MWRVSKTPCLQGMSDAIVNATSQYISPNQPIPDWVYSIADPTLRQEKIGEGPLCGEGRSPIVSLLGLLFA